MKHLWAVTMEDEDGNNPNGQAGHLWVMARTLEAAATKARGFMKAAHSKRRYTVQNIEDCGTIDVP